MVTSHQQSQPTVVVTSHLPVVSVGSFTPNQLAQTLVKQAGGSKTVTQAVGSAAGINPNRLTPQQINILKQKALMKQNANNKQLQGINSTAVSAGSATAAVSSGQKVSIAVTPSGVTLATLANSMPVTVVTQALGQQKTQVRILLFFAINRLKCMSSLPQNSLILLPFPPEVPRQRQALGQQKTKV